MAFGDVVQSASGSGTTGNGSATLSVGATAGNLLVFAIARAATGVGVAWGSISGFSAGPSSPADSGNMCGAMWSKIATGGETTVSTAMTSPTGNWTATIVEYEGPFDATPIDVTAEDETHLTTTTSSKSSGTTATTAQADALAIGFYGIDNGANFGTKTYSNSFSEVITAVTGSRAGHTQARRVLSSTGTYESTLSYSSGGTADEMYGAIMVFKKDAGGGGGGTTWPGWVGAGWW